MKYCKLFQILHPYDVLETSRDFKFFKDPIPDWPSSVVKKMSITQKNAYQRRNNLESTKSRHNYFFLINTHRHEQFLKQSKITEKDISLYVNKILPSYIQSVQVCGGKTRHYGYRSLYFPHLRGRHIQTMHTNFQRQKYQKRYPKYQRMFNQLVVPVSTPEPSPTSPKPDFQFERDCVACGERCTRYCDQHTRENTICRNCFVGCDYCQEVYCPLCRKTTTLRFDICDLEDDESTREDWEWAAIDLTRERYEKAWKTTPENAYL